MSESFEYENLIAGSQQPLVNVSATIAEGCDISRGQLLGKVTATGKLEPVDGTANDGREDPYAIAAEDVDATDGDKLTTVYVKGEFNERAVLYSYGDDADDWRDACEAIGIYLRPSVATTGEH